MQQRRCLSWCRWGPFFRRLQSLCRQSSRSGATWARDALIKFTVQDLGFALIVALRQGLGKGSSMTEQQERMRTCTA